MKTVSLEVNVSNLAELLKKSGGWPHTCINPTGMSREQIVEAEYRTTDLRRLFIVDLDSGCNILIAGRTFRQAFSYFRLSALGCFLTDRPG